jgi:hypothetical protein
LKFEVPPPVEVIEPKTELEPFVPEFEVPPAPPVPPAPTVTVYVPVAIESEPVRYPPAPPPPPKFAAAPPPPAITKYSVTKSTVCCEPNDKVPVALNV